MSVELLNPPESETLLEEEAAYRSLSAPAVVGLILGVVSLVGLFFPSALLVAAIAVGVAGYAWWSIRRATDLTGESLAVVGLVLGLFSLAVGGPWHAYVYATEVPEGFERIQWHELQPPPGAPENSLPPLALSLDGQQVFIKGYIHPLCPTGKTRRCVIVPNFDTCCFGGQPKITHMIDVVIRESAEPTAYAQRLKNFAGTLKVHRQVKQHPGLQAIVYELVDAQECL